MQKELDKRPDKSRGTSRKNKNFYQTNNRTNVYFARPFLFQNPAKLQVSWDLALELITILSPNDKLYSVQLNNKYTELRINI